jgi:hypothetical protein
VKRILKHQRRRKISLQSLKKIRIQKFKPQKGKGKKISFLLNQKKMQLTSLHFFLTKMGFWLMLYNSKKRMLMLFQSVQKLRKNIA